MAHAAKAGKPGILGGVSPFLCGLLRPDTAASSAATKLPGHHPLSDAPWVQEDPWSAHAVFLYCMTDPSLPLLYGSTDSGHSYKVRLFLLLAGVPHRYEWVDLGTPRPQRPAAFRVASRFGEVPVWVDAEGRSLCQSNAILVQLARQTGRLAGAPRQWPQVTEWLGWEANRIGFSLPNLRVARHWAPQPPDVDAWLLRRTLADLAVLDVALDSAAANGGTWLLPGDGPTIADLSCAAYLYWLHQAGLDVADYPAIGRWLAALAAQPGWQHPDQALVATLP
jgi:glutathione S-transferase